ncbi:alpha/beta fold hydrolase [Dyadobacter arcticus]|uniref:Pimeloyl-ACP methyl ester carboxylesterase n=1 Tax=Dyadobacter arcticus TaxID=1078754 RepID=A0ABX0UNL1_9BACT|nr:alpha/beta fold hydrolase [Dyadobacter arcticus]NIJ54572.1 pimeloyl-ACP methyl ester carboxylesterase [Dyadobacter arcticus]
MQTQSSTLNFLAQGDPDNPVLVFLHFFGGSSRTWSAVMEGLSDQFYCVAPDLPGWGDSAAPSGQISVKASVDLVMQLLKSLDLDHFTLVGHSMGGKIAYFIAAHQPQSVQNLILIAPSPPTPEPMSEEDRINLSKAFANRPAVEKLMEKTTFKTISPLLKEAVIHDHLQATYNAWNSWIEIGSREDISNLRVDAMLSALIVSGEKDSNFSSGFLKQEFTKYFPSALFHEVPETGHLLPLESPSELVAIVRGFIEKNNLAP